MSWRRVLMCVSAGVLCATAACCEQESPRAAGAGGRGHDGAPVRIAAAASLRFVLDELVAEFGESHPGVKIETTYGATGTLASQLRAGAEIDVFLAADMETVQALSEEGLANERGVFAYGHGRLVAWQRLTGGEVFLKEGLAGLRMEGVKKIAIASPRHAPYGRAAVSAMKAAGVYEAVSDKIVEAENVAQAAQFGESGAADVALIALSLALSPPMKEKGARFLVPAEAHAPLEHGGMVTARGASRQAASAFREFLLSGRGVEILARYGYEQVKR